MLRTTALLLAALGSSLGLLQAEAKAETRVAVLPMVVHSLDGRDFLRAGLADMLASRLGRSPGIAVIRVEDETQATTLLPEAREVARSVDADFVVFGSFTQFGEGASLDVHCATVEETKNGAVPRQIFIQSGTIGEIIPKLDVMVEKTARYIANPSQTPPAVSAPPPDADGSQADREVDDALSELDSLRERVDALERAVYDGVKEAPEVNLDGPSGAFEPLDSPDPNEDSVR